MLKWPNQGSKGHIYCTIICFRYHFWVPSLYLYRNLSLSSTQVIGTRLFSQFVKMGAMFFAHDAKMAILWLKGPLLIKAPVLFSVINIRLELPVL